LVFVKIYKIRKSEKILKKYKKSVDKQGFIIYNKRACERGVLYKYIIYQ
jgi:hypothetical protein